jgi:hypothetical protein
VTLGNAALRTATAIFDPGETHAKNRLSKDGYGTPIETEFEGRAISWLPLVHPRSGARTKPWPEIHAAWERALAG